MDNNLRRLIDQFEENKGQFVIVDNKVSRFVCISEDDLDYYYVTYDGRKIRWHSSVGRYMPLKGRLDERDYNELVRLAKINHFDQEDFFMPSDEKAKEAQKKFADEHKKEMMKEEGYDKYLVPFCWDIN